MQTYIFTGWVTRINRKNPYGPEIFMRNDKDESQIKYPQHILLCASKRKADIIPDDLCPDAKIEAKFLPTLTEGVSDRTNRAYAINKNYLMELKVLEMPSSDQQSPTSEGDGDDDMPF